MKGFTLLELLLACFISSLLALLLVAIILAWQKENHLQSALLELQENAQFAQHLLTQEIRPAGFLAGQDFDNISYLNQSIEKISADNSLKISNDDIYIKKLQPQLANLCEKNHDNIVIINSLFPQFKANDEILLTNCQETVVATVQQVSLSILKQQQTIYLKENLPFHFAVGTLVGLLQQDRFYLAPSRIKNTFALFQESNQKRSEILSGVVAWQIDAYLNHHWLAATSVQNWGKVKALQIDLLLRSSQHVFSKPEFYHFHSAMQKGTDLHLYREFIFFIPLEGRS